MAFETTICEECPTPIQWQQLRKHYLFLINTALDVRDAKLKEQDQTIALLRAEVKAWRDWRKLVVRYMTNEQPDPTVKIDALKDAKEATDAAGALEDK